MSKIHSQEYTFKKLRAARTLFESKETTPQAYQKMTDGLSRLFFHCRKEDLPLVQATLMEATWRLPFFQQRYWKKVETVKYIKG